MKLRRPVQVVVVDDHEIVRVGVRALLDREPDINVIGTAPTGEDGLDLIEKLHPDVAVLDYNLPGMSGVELCAEITTRWPDIEVVMLTTFLDDAVIRNSLYAGAKAYVYKDVEARDLKRAIRAVIAGESVLDTKVASKVMKWARAGSSGTQARLSPRELDVLRQVVRGLSNREIAKELGVTLSTVKTCLTRALRKLGCHSRAQAATLAAKQGFL